MKLRFQQPEPSSLGLSVDIPLDNFVTTDEVHDYSQLDAATFAVTAATPAYPGFLFNGSSSLIAASVNTAGDITTNDFSIAFWLKADSTNNTSQRLVSKRTVNVGYEIFLNTLAPTVIETFVGDAGGIASAAICTTDIHDDNWHHIVITYDRSGNATGYVDGVEELTIDISARNLTITNTDKFTLGRFAGSGTGFYDGILSGVRMYESNVLSAEEVLSLYNLTRWKYSI